MRRMVDQSAKDVFKFRLKSTINLDFFFDRVKGIKLWVRKINKMWKILGRFYTRKVLLLSDFLGSDQNTMYLLWFGLVPVHVAIIGWNSLGRDNAVK